MSIRSALEKLSGQGGPLRLHVPVRRSFTVERHIFLGPHVQRFVDCHEELETKFHQVAGRTLALFDRFSNGSYLTFGVNPHDKKSVSWIARVDPVSEGIVDFRITDPNPAVRIWRLCDAGRPCSSNMGTKGRNGFSRRGCPMQGTMEIALR